MQSICGNMHISRAMLDQVGPDGSDGALMDLIVFRGKLFDGGK